MKNNFELLVPLLSEENMALLQERADLHLRYSSIDFKVLEAGSGKIVVRIRQGKSHAGNYFDNKRLSEIGKELFEGLGAWNIVTRPFPYQPLPTDVVTAKWISEKIEAADIKIKDLSVALGIDANTISAYKSGLKPLTAPVKAAFYYYFKD